jgi:hypothetical protein
MQSLVNVQYETQIRAELSEAAIRRLPRNKRQVRHLGLRANTDIESKAIITYFAFAPTLYESEQEAYDAGYKYLFEYSGGFVAMLNPCPSLRITDHRGVYCNHASKGSKPANARMSTIRKATGIVAGQRVGFEATLFAKAGPIAYQEFVRVAYGPKFAKQIAASTAAQFEARTGKDRHLKIGPRSPPAQEQRLLEVQAEELILKKAVKAAKEVAYKAAKVPSSRALPERPDRGTLKRQRWQ